MDVGLALPQYDGSLPGGRVGWSTVARWARQAEAAGMGSVWLSDHLVPAPARGGAVPQPGTLDPLVALGGLALATTRVRLGTFVLSAGLRPATIVAKALATVDVLAGGRLTVGLGAGRPDTGPDAASLGVLARAVEVVTATLGSGAPVPFLPAPLQRPRPPVWVAGTGAGVFDLVAGRADGWSTAWVQTSTEYRRLLEALERACERAGRDPLTVGRTLGLQSLVGEDEPDLRRRFERMRHTAPPGAHGLGSLEEWRTGRLVGSVEQVREQLAEWESLGVATIVAGPGALPFSVTDPDDLEILASALT